MYFFASNYQYADRVAWYENEGNGNFGSRQSITTRMRDAQFVYVADINNDDDFDVLSVSFDDDYIAWYENDGNGDFGSRQVINAGTADPLSVHAADMDNDGDFDVLSSSSADDRIAWYENDGNGNFGPQQVIAIAERNPQYVYATDLDNDGDLDVLSASYYTNQVAWYENDGNGNFGPLQIITTEVNVAESAYASDLDNDGDNDVLSASVSDDKIAWYENDGNGNFGPQQIISTDADGAEFVYASDLDNDGDFDVLSSSRVDNKIAWYENDGNGNFGPQQVINSMSYQDNSIHTIDLDNDNDLDVLVSMRGNNSTVWHENDGNGDFGPAQIISTSFSPRSAYATDMDNDGDFDVLLALRSINSSLSDYVAWHENDGNGNFGPEQVITTLVNLPYSTYAVDIDNDGDPDILSASIGDDKIAWYENLLGDTLTTVTGRIYWDQNSDSIFNNEDVDFAGIALQMEPDGYTFYTNSEGEFTAITPDTGMHTLSVLSSPYIQDCEGSVDLNLILPEILLFSFEYAPNANLEQDFVFVAAPSNCRDISGIIFIDENENGAFDSNENEAPGVLVNSNGFGSTYSNSQGQFTLSVPTGQNVSLSIELNSNSSSNGYCNISSTLYSQTFPADNANYTFVVGDLDIDTLDFGVFVEQQGTFDVGLYSLVVQYGDEAGKPFHSWMDFKANGIITEACTLRIDHPSIVSLTQSSIPPLTQANDYVEWVFPPGSAPSWYCMQMDWVLDSTAVEGDTLHWEAHYNCPPGVDACPANNSIIRDVIVQQGPLRLASTNVQLYSMRPEGILPEVIENDQTLSYVITFQNPLATTAYNVTIIDTLPNEIDITTISRPFSSFPNYSFRITEDRVLIWELEGINLTDMEVDELNSYGFIQFNASLNEGLSPGTLIPNKANIFFNGIGESLTNEVVHVIGAFPPEAVCQNTVDLFLDENGDAMLTPEMIDNGSLDNMGIESFELSQEAFDCSNLGTNSIQLTVTDQDENTDDCTSEVIVLDTIPPIITCRDTLLIIGVSEEVSITGNDLITTSTDNCSIDEITISQSTFSNSEVGSNSIQITVSDESDNSTECSVNVEVAIVSSVIELAGGSTIFVAPNPFSNNAQLTIEQKCSIQLQYFNC